MGVTLNPYGTKIGIRISSSQDKDELDRLVAALDWPNTGEEVVDVLISIRFAPQAQRGRRHFNLLYLGAQQIDRNLDKSDFLERTQFYLITWSQQFLLGSVFLSGQVAQKGDRITAFVYPHDPGRAEWPWPSDSPGVTCLSKTGFALDPAGRAILPGRSVKLDDIVLVRVPDEKPGTTKPLAAGTAAASLVHYVPLRKFDPALAFRSVTALAANVRAYESECQTTEELFARFL